MNEPHPITQALVAAISHSVEPMVLSDPNLPDNPMIAVNDAFCDLTLYPLDDVLGRNCRFLQGSGTVPDAPRRIGRCIAERRGCVEWVLNYRADGSKFWNLLFISPVFDTDGRLLHFFGNQRNITQGRPAAMPDYVLGKADMPIERQMQFHDLLPGVLRDAQQTGGPDAAGALERLVNAARQIDTLSMDLTPAPWSMPTS